MRRPLIGARDFETFIRKREQAQRRSWRLTKGEGIVVWGKKKKGGLSVRKDLVLMCGEVFIEKLGAKIKHGRKLCVASTCSKTSGFLVQ
jgi:hypothetical protein